MKIAIGGESGEDGSMAPVSKGEDLDVEGPAIYSYVMPVVDTLLSTWFRSKCYCVSNDQKGGNHETSGRPSCPDFEAVKPRSWDDTNGMYVFRAMICVLGVSILLDFAHNSVDYKA